MRLVPARERTDELDPARVRAQRAAQLLARGELGRRLIEAAREGARGERLEGGSIQWARVARPADGDQTWEPAA